MIQPRSNEEGLEHRYVVILGDDSSARSRLRTRHEAEANVMDAHTIVRVMLAACCPRSLKLLHLSVKEISSFYAMLPL